MTFTALMHTLTLEFSSIQCNRFNTLVDYGVLALETWYVAGSPPLVPLIYKEVLKGGGLAKKR